MIGSSDHEDVDVPLRLQPVVARPQGWRGRSPGLIAAGLAGFVVVAIVLATAFDDGRPTSSETVAVVPGATSATANPTRRPTPRPTTRSTPLPTHLPAREVIGGRIPTERRLVLAEGLQLLDLATGELSPLARGLGYDAQLTPGGEIVCACVIGTGPDRTVRFGRYSETGEPIVEKDIIPLGNVAPVPNATEGFTVAAALDPDGGWMLVLVTRRLPPAYAVDLLVVDVASGEVVARAALDEIAVGADEPEPSPSLNPDGTPPDGTYVWGGQMAVSEGGRTGFVQLLAATVQDGEWTNRIFEWMVDFAPGARLVATPIVSPTLLPPDSWCQNRPVFVDPDELVELCARVGEGAVMGFSLRRIGRDGVSLGDIVIDASQFGGAFPPSVIVDRRNRSIYLWHPRDHRLLRVDADTGTIEDAIVPPSMLPGGAAQTPELGYFHGDSMIVLSPDGRRLYALGITGATNRPGTPSGIWVFATDPLELIGHWEPRAFLESLAVSADGRFVYAVGAPGYDASGRTNPWPSSVIVHDAVTGEAQVIYGAVSRGGWLTILPLP
jgi:hypothetical protein